MNKKETYYELTVPTTINGIGMRGLYGERAKILSLSYWYSPTELKSPVKRTETNTQLVTIITITIPRVLNFNIYLNMQGISNL